MAPFGNRSVLRGLDGEDEDSIRRVMNALTSRLAGVTAAAAARMAELAGAERGIVDHIFNTAAGNDLLTNMIERFGSARNVGSSTIIQVARDFDRVAVEAVQDPQARLAQELITAQENFRQLVQNGRFIYYEDGINEYGQIQDDSDGGASISEEEVGVPIRLVQQITTKKRTRRHTTVPSDDDSHANDSVVEYSAEDSKGKGNHFQPKASNKKNTPIRPQGTRCIDDGTHDREVAQLNKRDDTKLSMTFKLEKDDPRNPDRSISAGSATYTYYRAAEVDWTSKASLRKLNSWRQGNYNRQIGPRYRAREFWLAIERDELIRILQQHLASREVRGRWRQIDWADIECQYNALVAGTNQSAGELTAKRQYSVGATANNRKATSESRPIKKARTGPTRTAQGLRNQIEQFVDSRARQLVKDAKDKDFDQVSDWDDDDDQAADDFSDWGADSGAEPKAKRQRTGNGKEKEVVHPRRNNQKSVATTNNEDHDTSGEEETAEERLERETQETLEISLKEKRDGDDDNANANGGPPSSSGPGASSSKA